MPRQTGFAISRGVRGSTRIGRTGNVGVPFEAISLTLTGVVAQCKGKYGRRVSGAYIGIFLAEIVQWIAVIGRLKLDLQAVMTGGRGGAPQHGCIGRAVRSPFDAEIYGS